MRISLHTDPDARISFGTGADTRMGMTAEVSHPEYVGPVEVIPSEHEQVLHTARKSVESDIIVNPIPSNYGLIQWNGSVLTVS